jgi:EAL domain-containing protein (putative c-di-GMP-specific phosphodiesterase class I)
MKLSDLHIRRHDDGTYAAVWGPFMLKSGFQPIFKMGTGPTRIGAFEALCRPLRDGLALSPAKFFPMVPQSDRYRVELQTRSVHVLNAPTVLTDQEYLFLNFDPSLFADAASVEMALVILEETLKIADVDRKRIVCEVTEHKTTPTNLLMLVSQIRTRGFRIAVDDFGAADSDMARVRNLSPDIVKFDAQWITGLMDSGTAGADILKDMVASFKDRGIITLFEGMEHGWQLDLAVECGVEFVQGYVLARPQTVPSNFHDFRSKQNMKTEPLAERRIDPNRAEFSRVTPAPKPTPQRADLNSFNSWDREMAASMEAPPMSPAFTNTDRSRFAGAKTLETQPARSMLYTGFWCARCIIRPKTLDFADSDSICDELHDLCMVFILKSNSAKYVPLDCLFSKLPAHRQPPLRPLSW